MKRRFTILSAALALLVVFAIPMGMRGQTTASVTFSEQGYSNQQAITTVEFNGVTATFDKGTNSNAPKYYTSGTAIRVYGGNTVTITADDETISAITITFGSSDGSNAITSNVGTYSNGSWTGSATSVTFTVGGSTGNRRFAGLSVTYGSGDTPVETVATPTFSPAAGTYTSAQTVSISCATSGATIYYTTDGSTPTTGSSVYSTALNISETTTVKAMAVKTDMNNSVVATATYTINLPYTGPDYVRVTDITALSNGAKVIIAARYNSTATSYYAMTAATTGKPAGVTFTSTTSSNGEVLPASILNSESTYYWTLSVSGNDYTFTNASNEVLGYTSSTNFATGGDNTAWTISRETSASGTMVGGYQGFNIINKNQSGRGIALNSQHNYGPYATSNMTSTSAGDYNFFLDIFVQGYVPATVATPTFDPQAGTYYETKSVTISCDTPNSTIYYTTNGNEPTSASTEYSGTITVSETTTIKAIAYVGANYSNVATATYTIKQPISTIPALFAAATSNESNVLVTFNNWVVSGVSTNGKNVFVTDNNGNGFVIFDNDGGLGQTYAVGNILSGTAVSCVLVKYNGYAELKSLDVNDLTINTGGTVSTANIAMASLDGVNTGALVHYDGLTCSVTTTDNNTYYRLSDGTTTLQVYNALYVFNALEDGKTYNITGIYQQYNSTKEICPRSAADIVENTTCYTVTLCDDQSELTEQSYGAGVTLPSRNDSGNYTFAGWSETNVGGTETQTAPTTINLAGTTYYPTTDIVLYPVYTRTEGGGSTTTEWRLTSLADIDEGVYALLTNNDYAFNGTINSSGHGEATSACFVFDAYNVATSVPSGLLEITFEPVNVDGAVVGYKLHDLSNNRYLYASKAGSGGLAWHNDEECYWKYDNPNNVDNLIYSKVYTNTNNEQQYAHLRSYSNTFRTYAGNNNNNIHLAKKVAASSGTTYYTSLLTSIPKTITGYGNSSNGGYCLIASPIVGQVSPEYVTNMTSGSYDLFYFKQNSNKEWINYKPGDGSSNPGFKLVPGKGYLYANSETVTLTFTGTVPSTADVEVSLEKIDGYRFSGWNLVGNPFAENAYIAEVVGERPFYTMNSAGTSFVPVTNASIQAMEGVFVIAETNGEKIHFTTTPPSNPNPGKGIVLNLGEGRQNIDRAIVRFGEGRTLPKLQLFEGSTKLYIPQDGQDFAVVRSEEMGEMPVNFEAENNGTFSLNVSGDNTEFAYLHLIDNLTGKDIDLLQTPSYCFEAKTTDYASRFKLVYATGDNSDSDNFAFFSNGGFVINNEGNATLQVIDVTGRIVKSESINGCANVNVNAASGVYMLRLVNGDNVKTQKVVVK